MAFKKQKLFGLDTTLPFGKYKGKSIAHVYSGDATSIIRYFREIMHGSLGLIFSEEFYGDSVVHNLLKLVSGWHGDFNRINQLELRHFVSALKSGAVCNYNISSNRISVTVEKDDEMDVELSQIACKIAKEYITRCFAKVDLSNDGSEEFFRPALLRSSLLDATEEKLSKTEGNPDYIQWCIGNVDGFCLKGSKECINELNDLPVFSLDSLEIKAGKIKRGYYFKFNISLTAEFVEIDQEIVSINHKKYCEYTKEKNTPYYPEEVFHDELDNYHDDSDDEDNIMRSLDSGNGDQFGF